MRYQEYSINYLAALAVKISIHNTSTTNKLIICNMSSVVVE